MGALSCPNTEGDIYRGAPGFAKTLKCPVGFLCILEVTPSCGTNTKRLSFVAVCLQGIVKLTHAEPLLEHRLWKYSGLLRNPFAPRIEPWEFTVGESSETWVSSVVQKGFCPPTVGSAAGVKDHLRFRRPLEREGGVWIYPSACSACELEFTRILRRISL